MTGEWASLELVNQRPSVRLERWFPHGPEKVWLAVTEPAELAHWFPALIEAEPRIGARMTFRFDGLDYPATTGEVLEYDRPKVYAFAWNGDVLRFELTPEGSGCRLVFVHTFGRGDGTIGRITAGRQAAGWDQCLAVLESRLDGAPPPSPRTDWHTPMSAYAERFGLAEGEVLDRPDGPVVRFARDLVWKPLDEVWSLLTGDEPVTVGGAPPLPATNGYVAPSTVTAAEAPRLLEYTWLAAGADGPGAGRVRWEFVHDPLEGTRVELTQTLPAHAPVALLASALAAWHTQLELFFAATHGKVICPWPAERTEELEKLYTTRLS